VEFEEARDAQAALDNMNNGEFFGRVIKCSMAKPVQIKDGSSKPGMRSFSLPHNWELVAEFCSGI